MLARTDNLARGAKGGGCGHHERRFPQSLAEFMVLGKRTKSELHPRLH